MGRGPLQAYAYLMYSSEISSDALGRLHFLHEKSYLGAGFEIAQRDLELRGAGSLLGKAQKGARSSTVNVGKADFREQLQDAECEQAVLGLVESVVRELAGQVALESASAAAADARSMMQPQPRHLLLVPLPMTPCLTMPPTLH